MRKSLGGWIRRRRRRDSYSDLWRYERMEGASHWIPLDQPERLNWLLLEFLPTRSASRRPPERERSPCFARLRARLAYGLCPLNRVGRAPDGKLSRIAVDQNRIGSFMLPHPLTLTSFATDDLVPSRLRLSSSMIALPGICSALRLTM